MTADELLIRALDEVTQRGAPAQRAEAARLTDLVRRGDCPAGLLEEAAHLIDAYRNDPYLWR